MKRRFNPRIDRLLHALALLILLTIAILGYRDWQSFRDASLRVDETREILKATETFLSTLKDAENGQRGYLLAGHPSYLEPYHVAAKAIPHLVDMLAAATASKPKQATRVRHIRDLTTERLFALAQGVDLRAAYGPNQSLSGFQIDQGKQPMDEIRKLCTEITSDEYTDLTDNSRRAERLGQSTRLIMILGGCFLFGLLLYTGRVTNMAIEQRERLVEQLDASRLQFQTTLVSIGDAVIATDADGIVTFLNQMAVTLTGWQEAEAVGKPLERVYKTIDEETRAVSESLTHRVLDGMTVRPVARTLLVTKEARETPVEDSGAPIRDPDGRITGLVLVFRDVAARREAERIIQRWEQVFRYAAFGMAVTDPVDNRLQAINPAFAAMHGYTIQELSGMSLADLESPESRADLPAHLSAVRETGHHIFEAIHLRKDGTPLACLVDMTACRDDRGREMYRASYFSDITERKQIQETLRESEERFRTLAVALPQLIWSASPAGDLEYVNPLWLEYAGWGGNHRLPPDPWAELVHADDLEQYVSRWQRSLQMGEPFEMQARLRRDSDGSYRWFLCRAVASRNEAGRVVRWLGACTDVEEQVRNTADLQAVNEALRRSNADLEQFAYAASHDLQEPLRMVAIYSQLLKEEYRDKLDEQACDYIDFAVKGAQRMETLLKDLLAYARAASSAFATGESCDADEALSEALLNLEAAVRQNGASILTGTLPRIRIPKLHLTQVFQNLISNALKYRRDEIPQVHVEASRHGRDWLFAVRDNGLGIESQYLTQIFGVFKRLHGSEYEGTGIGLALCQTIVSRAGGRIWVESEPGNGSTFFFTLPAA